MYVVDASVWASRFIPQDAHHLQSIRWLTSTILEGVPLAVPSMLLAEVAGAVARRLQRADLARQAVHVVLNVPSIRLVSLDTNGLAERAADVAATLQMKGSDAVYVAVASEYDFALVTWDDEQRERAANLVDARTPDHGPP